MDTGGVGGVRLSPTLPPCCDHAREIQTLHARLDALTAQLPPDPLYSLPQAALLLYVSPGYLACLLRRYRPSLTAPKYRWDAKHVSHRLLPLTDLNYLRSRLLTPSRSRRMTTAQREAIAHAAAQAA